MSSPTRPMMMCQAQCRDKSNWRSFRHSGTKKWSNKHRSPYSRSWKKFHSTPPGITRYWSFREKFWSRKWVTGRYALSTLKGIAGFTIKLPDFFNSRTINFQAYVKNEVVGRHDIVLGVKKAWINLWFSASNRQSLHCHAANGNHLDRRTH